MKKLIILLLFLPISIFSQVDLKNRSLTDSNLAILYIGIYNEIKITAYKVDSTFNIKSSNGKVIESDWRNNSFTVKPHLGTVDTLTLFQNGKLILSKIYELKRIPDPIAQLGNITDTTATIKEILSNPELRIILPNCNYKMSFRVISYSALLIQNSGDTLNEYNSKWDCKLPGPLIIDIMYSNAGDRIILYHITVRSADSSNRTLNPLTITIKEED